MPFKIISESVDVTIPFPCFLKTKEPVTVSEPASEWSLLSCSDLWLSFTLCAFNWLFISVKHIHLEQHSKCPIIKEKLRYDSFLLLRVQQKETRLKKTHLVSRPFSHSSPFFFLPVSLSLSVCLPTMQPINSAACLVISSLGQTENERWGWVPVPLYAPDCRKSPPQRSHLHAGDLMNYRGLFMPLKARWVTTL